MWIGIKELNKNQNIKAEKTLAIKVLGVIELNVAVCYQTESRGVGERTKKKTFQCTIPDKARERCACVCVCLSYLWSRVFRLCCAVSHLAVFHIEGSFGTLLHTKQTAISQAVSKIS